MSYDSIKPIISRFSLAPCGLAIILPAFLVLFPATQLQGATLQTRTLEAYQEYVEKVEQELGQRRNGDQPFLFTSTSPGNLISLSQDQVVIRNLHQKDETPKGMIHDWLGAVFLKGVSLDQAIDVIMDVRKHPEIFREIISTELLHQGENEIKTRAVYQIEGALSVVADADLETSLVRVSPARAQVICRSTRVNEVSNFGQPDQKLLPEGNDRGLIWKINNYITLEEADGGVTMECRSLHLSRDIPFGISFFLGPFLKKMPPELLESMLSSLRDHLAEKTSSRPGKEMAN